MIKQRGHNKQMKSTSKTILQCVVLAFAFSIAACNNASEPAKAEDHFLEEKLDTIKKAEAVDQLIQDAAAIQRRTIDEQSE